MMLPLVHLIPDDQTLTGREIIQTLADLAGSDPDRKERARRTLRKGLLLNPWDAALLAQAGWLVSAERVDLQPACTYNHNDKETLP